MRSVRFVFLLVCVLTVVSATAQQPAAPIAQAPQRDTQAVTILQQAVAAMANTAPTDSSAIGTVDIVEGSTTESGSIQVLTLGTSQTAETMTLTSGQRAVIYSNGTSQESSGGQNLNPPMQLTVTDQCADFPLPLILSALSNSDESFQYIGGETLDGTAVQHIRMWNSFTSNPHLQSLASFSARDLWVATASGLPLKITYSRQAGGGAVPSFPVEISFSNYTKVSGVLYPFQIDKSYNGTPWQTITIQSVVFNTGLTAAQFQVE